MRIYQYSETVMKFPEMLNLIYCIWLMTSSGNSENFVLPINEGVTPLDGDNADILERIPLNIPGRCPENMLLYPGSSDRSTWICDCIQGYLYFPLNDSCHEAYKKGPCKQGEYVILPKNEVMPKCEKNPCKEDGLVPYNGTCYSLKTRGGPCHPDVLSVNETTFELECTSIDSTPFLIIDAPTTPCPIGSRRNNQGLCKIPL